jgi:hypothetical protein
MFTARYNTLQINLKRHQCPQILNKIYGQSSSSFSAGQRAL